MTALSAYLETEVMEWWAEGVAVATPPTNIYVAAHTGDPGNDGTLAEVSGNGYARVSTTPGTDWTVTGTGPAHVDNDNLIQFPTATGTWGTISHISLWDAATGGNCLWQGALDATKAIELDDQLQFPAGDLNITLD